MSEDATLGAGDDRPIRYLETRPDGSTVVGVVSIPLDRMRLPLGGCWHWTGSHVKAGYGYVQIGGRIEYVHRLSYQLFVGKLKPGREVDHICMNKACFNPLHLRALTRSENARLGALAKAKSIVCANGHWVLAGNVIHRSDGGRGCRKCTQSAQRRYDDKRRAAT